MNSNTGHLDSAQLRETPCIMSFKTSGIFSLKASVTIEYLTKFSSLKNTSRLSRQILEKHDATPKNASVRARIAMALESEFQVINTHKGRQEYLELISLSARENPYYEDFFPSKDNVDTMSYCIPTWLREQIKDIAKSLKKETRNINISADALSRIMYIMYMMKNLGPIATKFQEIAEDFISAVPKTNDFLNKIGAN